jgi:uncharacterized protein YdhG (YjbR/CyaY superfamily)
MKTGTARNIDEYIGGFPRDVQVRLEKIRTAIRKAAPQAEEAIRYGIPTFRWNGNLIHFAAFTRHIGMYPAPRGAAAFRRELAAYEGGKGTVRFSMDRPIPFGLIRRIVEFRMKANVERAGARGKKKSSALRAAVRRPGRRRRPSS